jgi:hypothetical protein
VWLLLLPSSSAVQPVRPFEAAVPAVLQVLQVLQVCSGRGGRRCRACACIIFRQLLCILSPLLLLLLHPPREGTPQQGTISLHLNLSQRKLYEGCMKALLRLY